MSNPIRNALNPAAQHVDPQIFKQPDMVGLIFKQIQDRNFPRINKTSHNISTKILQNLFKKLKQDLTQESLKKRHPTLSSFIHSKQISNHQELVSLLQKEARTLGLTGTNEYQAFRSSIKVKDLLALDALIEQTNNKRLQIQTSGVNVIWITTLNLNSSNLTRIPYRVYQFQNLTYLFLRHNKLAALPKEIIGRLRRIEEVDLSDLPPEIGQLENLPINESTYNSLNRRKKVLEIAKTAATVIAVGAILYSAHKAVKRPLK